MISPILGGAYGILHDQITYTISDEYYTKFKFIQFNLEALGIGENIRSGKTPEIQLRYPRLGVSIVGFLATWWVGMIIGIILGLTGLLHQNGKSMIRISIKAIIITIITAIIIGLIGLAYGKLLLEQNPPNWYLPDHVIDRGNFIAVGSMHNFSYLGGLIGLIISVFYSMQKRKPAVSTNY